VPVDGGERRASRDGCRRIAPPDAAHLARDIADLDEAFARNASATDAQRASYQARRDALKAQLTAVLANEEVAV